MRFLLPFIARFSSVLPALFALSLDAQPSAVVFPKPFVVEHQRVETAADGSVFTTDPVTDYYGGSWIVSVRSNGNRIVLDFAKREITEVAAAKGTYWTLTFRQMGDLRKRLQRAEERPGTTNANRQANAAAKPEEIQVREISEKVNTDARNRLGASSSDRPGIRHLRISAKGSADADVWVDPTLPLAPAALSALEAFENDALGSTVSQPTRTSAELVAAARRSAGAVPIRTKSSLSSLSLEEKLRSVPSPSVSSSSISSVEDIALRAEPLSALPDKLLKIGDGFRRVPSPLETMAAFAEEEASRDSSRLLK